MKSLPGLTRSNVLIRLSGFCALMLTAAWLTGCATAAKTNQLVAASTVGLLSVAPTTNIGQTYYLGVFDPREQLPPTIYRLRVSGQASALSSTSFASGWVRADLVDSLSGRVDADKDTVRGTDENGPRVKLDDDKSSLNRRLIMFGPEGFREAPKNHRLVVVMGSSPDAFFGAVDNALGIVAGVTQNSNSGPDVAKALWSDMSRMREERRAIQTLLDLTAPQ
ncbi:hypothetical protein Jab_1c13100 [Janthinobacterium sp. HH01]|uniref:hypothetical protein n=1 Tax=Janthinobacterium sp. HH01 TaxID=1198452 RepID=UPI0002AE8D49|nr:hypothetical protein [Janthinobacterium sp. HH01]ELX12695.1 hypothetical protein Jab_1c13100 [Janthinobacterium sp. HH01]